MKNEKVIIAIVLHSLSGIFYLMKNVKYTVERIPI
jgi:hypothetical protein